MQEQGSGVRFDGQVFDVGIDIRHRNWKVTIRTMGIEAVFAHELVDDSFVTFDPIVFYLRKCCGDIGLLVKTDDHLCLRLDFGHREAGSSIAGTIFCENTACQE
jgi:hypothetical protein